MKSLFLGNSQSHEYIQGYIPPLCIYIPFVRSGILSHCAVNGGPALKISGCLGVDHDHGTQNQK